MNWETLLKIDEKRYINPNREDVKGILEQATEELRKEVEGCGLPIPDDLDLLEDFNGNIELSVIRTDNKHGHESFGWNDPTKKIVLLDDPPIYDLPTLIKVIEDMVVTANAVRDSKNSSNS